MRPRDFALATAALVLLAGFLRFDALGSGLPHPRTRPDELPVIQQIGRVDRGEPVDLLIYPHAYVYASWAWLKLALPVAPLFGVEAPGGLQKTLLVAPDRLFLLARALSALAGTAAVLLVMLLARREWGDAAALAAGLLLATCFLHARDSHSLKPDALLSLTVLLALAASARLAERLSPGRVAWAGTTFGLAMATKYTGILMAVPLYVAGWWSSRARGWRRVLPGAAVLAGILGAAIFVLSSPRLVVEGPLAGFARSVVELVLPGLFGEPDESMMIGRGAEIPEAFAPPPGIDVREYQSRAWYHGVVFHTTFSMWYGIGALQTLLAPFALAWGFATRRPLPVLAATACSVQALVMGLTPAVTARYLTQVLPVLMLLEAGLLAALAKRCATRWPAFRAGWVLGVLAVVAVAQPLHAILGHNRIARRADTRVMATEWMSTHLAPGSRIAFAGSVIMPYGQPMPPKGAEVVAHGLDPATLDAAGAEYLVVNEHELYFSTPDAQALAALRPRLRSLAVFDPKEGLDDPPPAVYERIDAYYIPFHGFDRVTRPGPRVEVFSLARGAPPEASTAAGVEEEKEEAGERARE